MFGTYDENALVIDIIIHFWSSIGSRNKIKFWLLFKKAATDDDDDDVDDKNLHIVI